MIALVYLVPAWLAGIFLQGVFGCPSILLLVVAIVSAVLAAYSGIKLWHNVKAEREKWLLRGAIVLITFSVGGLRYQLAQPSHEPDSLLYYVNQPNLKITGIVTSEPVYTAKTDSYRLSVSEISLPNSSVKVSGDIFVRTATNPPRNSGDKLQVQGTLKLPVEVESDGFPYRDYLARQGIYVTLDYPHTQLLATDQNFFLLNWLNSARAAARNIIKASIQGDEGDLLVAVLLGDRQGLSPNIKQDFQLSDTVHILAISGSNITIAIGLMLLVLRRMFKRKTALVLAMSGAILYVLMLGATPSAVRGGLMGSLAIIGILLGREYVGLTGLQIAALLMTIAQPLLLWNIGFELSFLGTLGLFLIARPLEEKMAGWPPIVREGVALTISAEATTLPLTMFYFHQLSFVAVFANLFGVPALELILASGALTVIGGGLFAPLGVALGWISWLFAAYLLGTVHFFAVLPFGQALVPNFHPIWIFVYYVVLTFGLLWWRGQANWLQDGLLTLSQSRSVKFTLLLTLLLTWGAVGFYWLTTH